MADLSRDELIAKLKAAGVDVVALQSQVTSLSDVLGKIKGVLKDDAKINLDDKADLAGLIKGIVEKAGKLESEKTELSTRVSTLEGRIVEMDAEKAVGVLLSEGKIVPAEKDGYLKLYKANKALFDELAAKMTKKVDFSEKGVSGDGEKPKIGEVTLSEPEAQKEIERYTKMIPGQPGQK